MGVPVWGAVCVISHQGLFVPPALCANVPLPELIASGLLINETVVTQQGLYETE